MGRDQALLPREATRLCALGLLSRGPMSYAALADGVRDFTAHFSGPSIETMGSSIELLRFEGLIGNAGGGDKDALQLTEAGNAALVNLLGAAARGPGGDFNKLAVALKLRFLHLLPAADRRDQAEALIETRESELARLKNLETRHAGEDGAFPGWLAHEIARTEADLAWFRDLRDGSA